MVDEFLAAVEALERAADWPERFSEPFVEFLPVTGAAVSTLGETLGSETISATDALAARLDEVQFDLGEGPCWEAMRLAKPVAESAFQSAGPERWPAFAAAVRDEPVSSVFAFPLIVGPLRLGAVDLYSADPVALDASDNRRAATLAEVIGRQVLRGALGSPAVADSLDVNPRSRRTIHQATGIVLAQLGMSADDALLIIQGHAFATNQPMMDVAAEIVDGRLAFHRDNGGIEVVS
ncbi:GAF and ANTAR domain-containing protein [Microbacterium pumilum]